MKNQKEPKAPTANALINKECNYKRLGEGRDKRKRRKRIRGQQEWKKIHKITNWN